MLNNHSFGIIVLVLILSWEQSKQPKMQQIHTKLL